VNLAPHCSVSCWRTANHLEDDPTDYDADYGEERTHPDALPCACGGCVGGAACLGTGVMAPTLPTRGTRGMRTEHQED
jgi:hypothetical protein